MRSPHGMPVLLPKPIVVPTRGLPEASPEDWPVTSAIPRWAASVCRGWTGAGTGLWRLLYRRCGTDTARPYVGECQCSGCPYRL